MRVTTKAGARRAGGFANLRKTIRGLREVASGAVLARVIIRASKYLRGRVTGELDKHVKTGLARRSATVAPSTKSIDLTLQSYRRYIRWSFAKGFPITALNRINKIAAEELQKAVRGEV